MMLGQEWLLLRRESVALWVAIGLVILLGAAALNGRALLAVESAAGEALRSEAAETRAAMAAQAARGVASAREPGALGYSVLAAPAVLPPAPLGALAIGQVDLLPGRYLVTARGAHNFLGNVSIDNSLRLALGNFDVAFVIVWLLPLAVIALTFNVVSGERERGVLAVAAAAGSDLRRFVAGKCLARGLLLTAALWAGLVLAAVLGGVPLGSAQGFSTWLAASLGATLYGAFWFALALWVNTRERASDLNASLLIGAWLLLVVLTPALTNLAATTVFAAPSRVDLTTALREATEAADQRAASERDRYFFDHPDMRGQDMDMTAYYRSVARSEREIADAMLPLLAQFERQALRQQRLVSALQYLSPGTLSFQLLTSLAGSDGARHRRLRADTLQFHERWRDFFDSRLARGTPLAAGDFAQLPQFIFQESTTEQQLRASAAPLAMLALFAVALLALGLRRLRRVNVVGES
jgi:ABC-2 type transport system permease protein